MLLELDGYTVDTCSDVAEAKATAKKETDVFVVDFHLARGTSGLDLVTAVRNGETAAPANTSIIVASGDHRRESEAMDAGANLFLHKPYPPNTLSEEISKLLGGA
jgi:DNA-binding response OmpR family regulator